MNLLTIMLLPDYINQLSLFDKALFLQQNGNLIETYKENNLRHTIYHIDEYIAEIIYNITYSQIDHVIIKENVSQINKI